MILLDVSVTLYWTLIRGNGKFTSGSAGPEWTVKLGVMMIKSNKTKYWKQNWWRNCFHDTFFRLYCNDSRE